MEKKKEKRERSAFVSFIQIMLVPILDIYLSVLV